MPAHEGPLGRLRRGHEELVLDLLRKQGPLSRGELGRHSGLSRTTLYDIVATLVDNGAVVGTPPDPAVRRRGRPVETLTLNPDAGQAIGIDFARRAVHVAAVNVAHEVIGSASEPHAADLPLRERVDIAERLTGTLAEGALRLGALSAIGVGVVGPVADIAPHPGAHAASGAAGGAGGADDLRALLHRRFAVPVLMDNNTRLAALAEATWGAAAGDQDVLYVRLSHGVGGGLVVGGSLHRGAYGLSGELGHIRVEQGGQTGQGERAGQAERVAGRADGRAGARCSCGAYGCLETVASVGAVLDAYHAAGGGAVRLPEFLASAAAREPAALGVLENAGARIGAVLAAVCNAVGPGVIVLGGELADAGAVLLDPVERALRAHILPLARDRVDLRGAALHEAGGALGAIALVLHESPLLARYPPRPEASPRQAPPTAPAGTPSQRSRDTPSERRRGAPTGHPQGTPSERSRGTPSGAGGAAPLDTVPS